MSLMNKYGTEKAQRDYFEREIRYRKALQRLVLEGGYTVITENLIAFKLQSEVKTEEDFNKLIKARYVEPTLMAGDLVMPQVMGVNTKEKTCIIFSYAPILKAVKGKVDGLLEALLHLLAVKGCSLYALVSGSVGGQLGNISAVFSVNPETRSRVVRAYRKEGNAVVEFGLPEGSHEEMFMKTFDADLWVTQEAWKVTA